jgi:hypothetical protein
MITEEEPLERLLEMPCPTCRRALSLQDGALSCPGHLRLRTVKSRGQLASHIVWLEDEVRHGRLLVMKEPYADVGRMPGEPIPVGEATVLSQLRDSLSDGPYRVPRLVWASADGGIILMDAVAGANLYERLDGPGSWLPRSGLGTAFERAGRWLNAFSLQTSEARQSFRAGEIVPRLQAFVSDLADRGYPAARAERLARLAEQTASDIEGIELPRSLIHGDLTPSHLYDDGIAVTALDFEQCGLGWPHEDAAFFLGAIGVWRARNPQAAWSGAVRSIPARFLRGYLADGSNGWETTERFFRLAAGIRWLMIEFRSDLAVARPFTFTRFVLPQLERRLAPELRRPRF